MVKNMNVQIDPSWKVVLGDYFQRPEWKLLVDFVKKQYQTTSVYPHPKKLFNAFDSTSFDKVSVVIIGQDPYHNPGQAHGLCFSVPNDITPPPSLRNIYKEKASDLHITKNHSNGNLTSWADQGVLLLNSVLTVEKNKPASHANRGWEEFTDYVIQKISEEKEHVVFLLWGNYAKKKGTMIDRAKHLVLESSHPSPLGAHYGFTGCKHFSQTNTYLKQNGKKEIQW